MSTRSTIWHSERIHLYEELIDDGVYLEYRVPGVTVDIELPPAALKALAAWVERNPGKEG